jgi:hypothetical protein
VNHQINPDTDPVAACLLIFAQRGARIRAEQDRLQSVEQITPAQTTSDSPLSTHSESEEPLGIQPS